MATRRQREEGSKSDKKKEEPIIVEIEFCSNCDAHLFTVRHQESKYYSHYEAIKKRLQQQKIVVRRRSVPENLYKKSPYCPPNVYYKVETNQVVYFPQVGSFEVYFQAKKIFSKLQTLKWPSPQGIATEVLKLSQEYKSQNQVGLGSQKLEKGVQGQQLEKKQVIIEKQAKKQQFRIKSKLPDQQLAFRYSIDRRNLFRKPENNYLNRKSMTARNHQSVSESTNRSSNHTAVFQKRNVNQEDALPIAEEIAKKELTDEAVLKMYRKKTSKKISNQLQKSEGNSNLPQIPRKVKKNQGQGNIYLQPIFPKSNINLENYSRQKQIMANKIHQQRKSYEASKQLKEKVIDNPNTLILKAKFNENCNELLKTKEDKTELLRIKEATEQNEIKQKDNIQAIVNGANNVEIKSQQNAMVLNKARNQASKAKQQQILKGEEMSRNEQRVSAQQDTAILQLQDPVKNHNQEPSPETKDIAINIVNEIEKEKENPTNNINPALLTEEKHEHETVQKEILNIDSVEQPKKTNEEKHELKQNNKVQIQQQQAYEAQFEEINEKEIIDEQKQSEKQEKVEYKEQDRQASKEIEPPRVEENKEDEKQYENDQFDKQQVYIKQAENKIGDAKDMVELINEKSEEVLGLSI